MLFTAGVAAAFAGAVFFAYYDNRLAENEEAVGRFIDGFDRQFTDAADSLDDMRIDAVDTIRTELEPLADYVEDTGAVVNLPAAAGPSVWLVETRDERGQLVTGSAFAVVGHQGGTAFVTSHAVVAAATLSPGPAVELFKGDRRVSARLWSWDEVRDLALLVVDEVVPPLELADEQVQASTVGRPVFALGGLGGQGASAVPGVAVDRSELGWQHTVPVGTLYVGGPLVDGAGRVVGLVTNAYRPLGVDPGAVGQAPDVAGLCVELLRCSRSMDPGAAEPVGVEVGSAVGAVEGPAPTATG
jgi:S1-C subfamily serine protease